MCSVVEKQHTRCSGDMLETAALYFYFRLLVKTTILVCSWRAHLNAYAYLTKHTTNQPGSSTTDMQSSNAR